MDLDGGVQSRASNSIWPTAAAASTTNSGWLAMGGGGMLETSSSSCDDDARKELKVHDNILTEEIALDCEMVEAREEGKRVSVLARVSLVNRNCQTLIDTYVDPMVPITDYRTRFSGIRPRHLNRAPKSPDVRERVLELLSGRTVIGHDLVQDLAVLGIKDLSGLKLRDTSRCYMSYFKPNERASLKRLASAVLGETIQTGEHDSLEDAKVTMQLYLKWIGSGNNEEDAVPVERVKSKSKKRNRRTNQATLNMPSNGLDNNQNSQTQSHNVHPQQRPQFERNYHSQQQQQQPRQHNQYSHPNQQQQHHRQHPHRNRHANHHHHHHHNATSNNNHSNHTTTTTNNNSGSSNSNSNNNNNVSSARVYS